MQDDGKMCKKYRSIFFFFSSRRRHTRYWRDWSSDVCSSDLAEGQVPWIWALGAWADRSWGVVHCFAQGGQLVCGHPDLRSEERRVGKECRSRWSPYY